MEAFGARMRGGIATLLSAALIVSGALLTAPAANAEEAAAQAPEAELVVENTATGGSVSDAPATEATPAQEDEAPADAATEPSPEVPVTSEAPEVTQEDANAADVPAIAQVLTAPVGQLPSQLEAVREGGGALDWGFKASWRSYLLSTFTKGTQQVYGGAVANTDGTVRYPESNESTFDAKLGTGVIAYTGGVQWQSEAHGFTIVMQNPRIEVAADGTATVSAETSTADTAGAASVARVVVATLSGTGAAEESDDMLTWAGRSGVFASTLVPDGVARYAGQSTDPFTFSTPAEKPAPVWEPAFSVALADGTPLAAGDTVYRGDKLVVTGSGFDPAANVGGRGMPIPSTLPQGSYVTFTQAEENWRPSSAGSKRIRNAESEKWILAESVLNQVPSQFQGAIRKQWTSLADDGAWSAEIDLVTPKDPTATGVYGVYTYGAGGVNNESQELRVVLNYVNAERPNEPVEPTFEPEIRVYLADGVTPYSNQEVAQGDKLVVKGSGFDPFANLGGIGQPIPADKPQGTFVVFGKFAESWKPSDGVASNKRTLNAASRGWLLAESTLENDVPALHRDEIRSQWVELDEATGSFSWTVTLQEPTAPLEDGNWGIYTYAGGVLVQNAAQELSVPLNFKAKSASGPEEPEAPAGDLQWGIYNQFRNYVESNPDGRVELLGAATRSGNVFGFTQASGGEWDAKNDTGEVRFAGGVAFFAHGDALSLTIENPILKVTESGAVLSARFDHGPQTAFADVDLSKAKRTVAEDGSVTWSGATTKMRQEGVDKFLGFYPAGTALDPLTFTVAEGADVPQSPEVSAVSSVTSAGLKVDVAATGLPGKIYAALIEKGTAANLDMAKPESYAAFAVPFPVVTDGNASFSLVAPADKLDRKKQYEVLVWKIHSMPTAENVYGLSSVAVSEAQWNELNGVKPPVVVPPVAPQPTQPGAGSLTWGISTAFANYVTGNIAKGSISTNGVGGGRGGYVFPQATGSSWNADTRTGTVRYSGTVTFTGHGGLMRETFANPVITVSSPTSGTISAGGQSFPLNLIGAGFTVNADGSATWSGVTVGGSISGGDGAGGGGTLGMDSLSFTVGSASGLNFGSTATVSQFAKARTAATTPPATQGLTVVTPAAKLVAGGEIEITSSGFQPNEQGILVVIYSEPTVLDTNAKADANGVVRWIGKLPKGLTGKHTITLQGSVNVGQEITIASASEVKKKAAVAAETSAPVAKAAEAAEASGVPAWAWWTGALALLVIAGAGTALVVAQRRKSDAPTHL